MPFVEKKLLYCPSSVFSCSEMKSEEHKENIILFMHRIEYYKNPLLLLESIKLIKNFLIETSYMVVIAGNGDQYGEVCNKVTDLGLGSVVKVVGRIDPNEYVPKSKIFISIQSKENFPSQSVLDAISCGCFIVASNVGNTDRIVKKDFGILVDLDPLSIANGIVEAIKRTDNQEKVNGIKRSAEMFSKKLLSQERYALEVHAYWKEG
jgi:glycosyltransferase involved in cell wall biosynthesis